MIPEIDCVDGGIVPYMGQNLRLWIQYEEGLGFAGIRLKDGELRIRTGRTEHDILCRVLKEWYRRAAGLRIPERTAYYARIMKETYNGIRIKDTKTRWGSCSGRRNLNFSFRLILAPEAVMDYVIVHELSHLKFMNHSKDFWNRVEEFCPDYRTQEAWLKENGGVISRAFGESRKEKNED